MRYLLTHLDDLWELTVIHLRLSLVPIVLGLLTGGVLAAPFAAWLVRHLPERAVMAAVGVLIVAISLVQLVRA